MRIIAGELRGRRVKSVEGISTRPTADKVKGAIFNVIREKIVDAKVLDLFAGTGNLALEAISQGASEAYVVEKNSKAFEIIKENFENVDSRVKLFKMDAKDFLAKNQDQIFDVIFLDPPYSKGLVQESLLLLSKPCRLSFSGVIVAETAKDEMLPEEGHLFEIRKTADYGDTKVWYLQRREINGE